MNFGSHKSSPNRTYIEMEGGGKIENLLPHTAIKIGGQVSAQSLSRSGGLSRAPLCVIGGATLNSKATKRQNHPYT